MSNKLKLASIFGATILLALAMLVFGGYRKISLKARDFQIEAVK